MAINSLWGLLGSMALAAIQSPSQTSPLSAHEVAPVVVTAPRPKWTTDVPLRAGMIDVQNAVVAEYFAACANGASRVEYDRLAGHLDEQSAQIAARSQVSGVPRTQLDALLREMKNSSDLLRGTGDPQAGVRKAIGVLISYSTDFNHPGWRPRHRTRSRAETPEDGAGVIALAPSEEEVKARTARLTLCRHLSRRDLSFWTR